MMGKKNSASILLHHIAKKYKINIIEEANEIDKIMGAILMLVTVCCEKIGARYDSVVGQSQKREISQQRQCIMTVMYETGLFSNRQIGDEFGFRHHSTVMHARQTVDDMIETKNEVFIRYMGILRPSVKEWMSSTGASLMEKQTQKNWINTKQLAHSVSL